MKLHECSCSSRYVQTAMCKFLCAQLHERSWRAARALVELHERSCSSRYVQTAMCKFLCAQLHEQAKLLCANFPLWVWGNGGGWGQGLELLWVSGHVGGVCGRARGYVAGRGGMWNIRSCKFHDGGSFA